MDVRNSLQAEAVGCIYSSADASEFRQRTATVFNRREKEKEKSDPQLQF